MQALADRLVAKQLEKAIQPARADGELWEQCDEQPDDRVRTAGRITC